MILVRICGPTFCAGAVLEGERIVAIAPLLASALRRSGGRGRTGLRTLVRDRGWKVDVVKFVEDVEDEEDDEDEP